jgi:ParB/Sulfiredoxin domain
MSNNTGFTDIRNKPGAAHGATDFAMMTQVRGRGDTAPKNIIRIGTDYISVPPTRQRRIDNATVDRLFEDITKHGLLQPIGVKQYERGYLVVYGVHRYLAFKRGWENAKRLLAERGDKDTEAYDQARMWESIPCIVYGIDMPVLYGELKEIAENLIRLELTKEERAIHEVKYANLLKKLGLVVTADEKRAETQKKNDAKKKEVSVGQSVPHSTAPQKPTVTEKVTADLGIDRKQLHRSHQKVTAMARAVARDKNLAPPKPITPETKSDQEVDHTVRLAEMALDAKGKAVAAGTDPRHAHPIDPQDPDEITVRIDITDPDQLLDWFEKRLDAASKPLTMAWLKDLHRGLGRLIKEREAAA